MMLPMILTLASTASATPDRACFPLSYALAEARTGGLIDQPVFVEEWSSCEGPSQNSVRSVAFPSVAVSSDPLTPFAVEASNTNVQLVQAMVADYNQQSTEGYDYQIRSADDGLLVTPIGPTSLLSEAVVSVDSSVVDDYYDARVSIFDQVHGATGIWTARPVPLLGHRPGVTAMVDQKPAWEALRIITKPWENTPTSYVWYVYPAKRYAAQVAFQR